MTAKPVDLELKKAFTELQQKWLETSQKLKLSDMQIETYKRSRQHADLTTRELKGLSPDTNTYESIGRMFVLTEIPVVCKNLSEKISTCEEKIKTLQSNKELLERSLKDSENNLRELVQQKKEASQDT
ncbi:hypothetical protein LSTR_LSTR007513 [Laodelphax striatellus]|uniref:Prefoldin subunit 1 n=1 Tax=Laodelphax striatellus TaxID=195883 RepID=A0A482X5F3_LAOST|nr:hypothetical protein LSTR_LSTR007513 [Laodelphax striatellus]